MTQRGWKTRQRLREEMIARSALQGFKKQIFRCERLNYLPQTIQRLKRNLQYLENQRDGREIKES